MAVTMGDPAGVGPETVAGAWPYALAQSHCRAVVIGNPDVLRRAVQLVGLPAEVVEVKNAEQVFSDPARIPCIPCGSAEAADVPPGRIDPRGGQAAYDALELAAQLAIAHRVDGIVTGPLSKAALHAAGHHYPGHTELLGEFCGVPEVAMMLYLSQDERVQGPAGLGVVHVTLHTSLRDAIQSLSEDGIVAKARLAHDVLSMMLRGAAQDRVPRIGVCALNPHAGEGGLFGDEELQLIGPAVERSVREGLDAFGPIPADTLMVRAAGGEFDAVVAMYHDQGHIALKLLGMHRAVNITLGLPIVRTSVAHGTAFDLAWQGRAQTTGMIEAMRVASQLVKQRALQRSTS